MIDGVTQINCIVFPPLLCLHSRVLVVLVVLVNFLMEEFLTLQFETTFTSITNLRKTEMVLAHCLQKHSTQGMVSLWAILT